MSKIPADALKYDKSAIFPIIISTVSFKKLIQSVCRTRTETPAASSNSGSLDVILFLIYCTVLLHSLSNTQESHPVSNWLDGISSAEGSGIFLAEKGEGPQQIPHRDWGGPVDNPPCPALICSHCSGKWFSVTCSLSSAVTVSCPPVSCRG